MAEKQCGLIDPECALANVVSGATNDAINNLAKSIMEGMSQMVTTLSTFWVSMPTANLATGDGVTPSPVVGFVNSELGYWTLALAVLSVILGGTRMIWEQRGAPLKDLLRSLLTLTLVSGLGLAVISILVIAADAFSASIIDRATDGKGFAEAMGILVMTNQTGVGVFILIILGLVGLLASLVQIVLMIVRGGMLVILAGILPTTAAFTNTEMGRQWFQKAVGWTIAFILYKPAAAVVYAVAFKLMGSSTGGNVLLGSITGFALMIVALLALPALMRFVTPMVGAVASGSGGGAGAMVGAMATGAVSMGRSGSGRGNASPTPGSQPGQAGASAQGSQGAGGSGGGNAKPTPGSTGPGGAPGKGTTGSAGPAASAGAGSTASTAGAGAGTAGAGAASGAAKAAGPTGMVVVAGAQAASRASRAAQQTAQDSTSQSATPEGPSGSN
jgi:type IV secretion system protein TrbL